MNPIERPVYGLTVRGEELDVEIAAPDWPALVTAAVLAVSDLRRPLGEFQTWTARRVSARVHGSSAQLERWVKESLDDWKVAGFLPALVELEHAEEGRLSGILRGGCIEASDVHPAHPIATVVPGSTVVTPGGGGAPWRARFTLRG